VFVDVPILTFTPIHRLSRTWHKIYAIWRHLKQNLTSKFQVIWSRSLLSCNAASYDIVNVKSNAADHFLEDCSGAPSVLFCRHEMGSLEDGFDLWKKEEVAGSKNKRISTWMFSLVKTCFTDKALWNGMSS